MPTRRDARGDQKPDTLFQPYHLCLYIIPVIIIVFVN